MCVSVFIGWVVNVTAVIIYPLDLGLHKVWNLVNETITQTEYLEQVCNIRIFSIDFEFELRDQRYEYSQFLFNS